MSRTLPTLLAMAAALPLTAADWTAADFGSQPVAIGAGARALGMGGAFSAVADDASAVTWNPAGLTQCERPELAASAGWYRSDLDGSGGQTDNGDLQLDHASALYPFFAAGCQQVLGLAWQRQFDFSRDLMMQTQTSDTVFGIFTDDREQIVQSGAFSSLGLSYAAEIRPGLSLGLTVYLWADDWTGAGHYRRDTTGVNHTEIPFLAIDEIRIVTTEKTARITEGISCVLGAFWQATPALTVAVVAKPAYELHLRDRTHTRETINGVETTDTTTVVSSQLRHPSSLALGAAWRADDLHTFSADVTVTRWSEYKLDDPIGTTHSPVNFAIPPSDFSDLLTLRLGYEYVAILPRAILVPRVGLLVEDLPAASRAPSLVQADQVHATRDRWFGLTAGLSVCQRQLIWDAAVQVRRGDNVGAGQFAPPDQTVDMTVTTARLGLTVQF